MKIIAKHKVSQLDSQLQDDDVISAGMSCWYLGSMDYFTPL